MKLFKIIFSIFLASSISGCGKWLDITPEDAVTEKELFSDYGGYYSALNGIYQTIASPEFYGKNLTWGYLSALSQYYDSYNSNNTLEFSYTEQYDYASDEVKAFGEEIWSQGYFAIANCNNLLQHLAEADPSMFPYKEYNEMNVIRAEALAVRALVHFDILRLFADAPTVNMDGMAVPYSKTYPDMFPQRLTTRQVLDNVIADFKEAADLLEPFDSLGGFFDDDMMSVGNRYLASNRHSQNIETGSISMGLFYSARGTHLNYIAVRALLARVYAYAGDMKAAYDCAASLKKVFFDEQGWYSYTQFMGNLDAPSRPHKLIDDIVVSFYKDDLVDYYMNYSGAATASSDNSYKLKNLDAIFADADDDRRVQLIVPMSNNNLSLKYQQKTEADPVDISENRIVPVMRFSELSLIMAEYLASQNDVAGAIDLLNELRIARGCSRTLGETISIDDLNQEIRMESWRENVAEGQYFFFCKRKNLPTIDNNGVHVPMTGKYTMQIPDSQTNVN